MISSAIWALIGVVVGTSLGFGLNLLKEYIQEKRQKRIYLEDLLADLEYNKKLAEEGRILGYLTLGYTDAKGAKYLFDLPKNLRNQIYDVQRSISIFYQGKDTGSLAVQRSAEIKKLKELLENSIPEFKKYLKK